MKKLTKGAVAAFTLLSACGSDDVPYSELYEIHGQFGVYEYALELDDNFAWSNPYLRIRNMDTGNDFKFIPDVDGESVRINGDWIDVINLDRLNIVKALGENVPLVTALEAICNRVPSLIDEYQVKQFENTESLDKNEAHLAQLSNLNGKFCPSFF